MNDELRKKLDKLLIKMDAKVVVYRSQPGDLLHAMITDRNGTTLLGEGYGRTSDEAVSAAMLCGEADGLIRIEYADADNAEYEMLKRCGWTPYRREYIDLPGIIYRAERNITTAGGFSGVVTICRKETGAWYACYLNARTASSDSAYAVLKDIDFLTGVDGDWTRMRLDEAEGERQC